jgi:hypothetical protein
MSAQNKDSQAVIAFMTLFEKLKDWSEDDPESLPELAAKDDGVKNLCNQVCGAARNLTMNERRHRELFAAPVDPRFLAAWRNYEARFAKPLARIWLADLIPDFGSFDPGPTSHAELNWDNADHEGDEQARAIETAIYFGREQIRTDFPEEYWEVMADGAAAWERLSIDAEFDLHGVFRRRELIPFVLIPRHVAAKEGSARALSMQENLRQAHEAFVFGTPYAALALMRSVMETMLRDHYGAQGKDLFERINQASKRLPVGASAAALHRLRKLANAILHLDPEKDEFLPKIGPTQLEKEIVSLLFALRALIEGAPLWRSP